MAIALAALPVSPLPIQAIVLALVGAGITALVYGAVAIIVKADDIGLALAEREDGWRATRALGRAIVRGRPTFLSILSAVGTAAMIWVGGGIILHGLESYGLPSGPIHHVVETVAGIFPPIAGAIEWLTNAAISGAAGMLVGATLIPVGGFVLAPAWEHVKGLLRFGK
jgi:predicted DNA repair protein MutK